MMHNADELSGPSTYNAYADYNNSGSLEGMGMFRTTIDPSDANNFSSIEGGEKADFDINNSSDSHSEFRFWNNQATADSDGNYYAWSRNNDAPTHSADLLIPFKINNMDKGIFTIGENYKNTRAYFQNHFFNLLNQYYQFKFNNLPIFKYKCKLSDIKLTNKSNLNIR